MRTGLIAALAAATLALPLDARAEETPKETPGDAGWSMGAGAMAIAEQVLVTNGYFFGLAVIGLGEGNKESNAIGYGTYIGTVGLAAATAPVIEIGARSARGVPGSRTARLIGWTAYGLTVATGLVFGIAYAAGCLTTISTACGDWNEVVGVGFAFALPLFGFTAVTAFGVDAFVSAGQAHRARKAAPRSSSARGLSLSPFFAPSAHGGALGGVGGTF